MNRQIRESFHSAAVRLAGINPTGILGVLIKSSFMCTRNDAFRYIVTNEYGLKQELKEKISAHYGVFLKSGFIYEPAVTESKRSCPVYEVREWVLTPAGIKQAKLLKLKAHRRYRLPATLRRPNPSFINRLLNTKSSKV